MLGMAEELFHPGAQHTEDERQRLEHTRVVEGGHEPGCGPIDLDSGAVLIVPPQADAVLPPRPRVEGGEDGGDGADD